MGQVASGPAEEKSLKEPQSAVRAVPQNDRPILTGMTYSAPRDDWRETKTDAPEQDNK